MAEFLEAAYDKFVFKVKVGYLYNADDFWAKVESRSALVGVTDFLQKVKGDVAFLETAEVGTAVRQGQEIGKIETIKATLGIVSPVSGEIVEVNPDLDSSPFLINEDPFGAGWIYRIELTDIELEKGGLLQAEDYFETMKEKIAREMKKK